MHNLLQLSWQQQLELWPRAIWLYLQLAWYHVRPGFGPGLLVFNSLTSLYWLIRCWGLSRKLKALQLKHDTQTRVFDNLLTVIFRLRKEAKERQKTA